MRKAIDWLLIMERFTDHCISGRRCTNVFVLRISHLFLSQSVYPMPEGLPHLPPSLVGYDTSTCLSQFSMH